MDDAGMQGKSGDPGVHSSELLAGSARSEDEDWAAERLRLVLAAARLGDFSWDFKTDVVTLSERAAEIFMVPAGAGMTWTELRQVVHPEDRERARIASERAVTERNDYSLHYRLINGRERWISAMGRGRYSPTGEVLGMYGVVQDITAHRILVRVDDAVRTLVDPEVITYTSARLLGEYLQVERCAYAFVEEDEDTFTLTGNYTNGVHSIVGRYRFRQFGAECLRLMRAGEPYVVGNSNTDSRIDPVDRLAYEATAICGVICVPILKSGRFVAGMAVHTKKPRSWFPDEVELVQQVASRCWESIERARVERERESLLRAAEAANRTKDEFLAMLGHELRNPLAPIVTALEIMGSRESASERERTIIERQVMHLMRLVDDLLDVSRIARGKVDLRRELVALSEVVASAVELAGPLLEKRTHLVDVQVAQGLVVYGDVARLTQVVANLLTNAAKYTPQNGEISIRGEVDADQVVLRVRDSGIGMAPEFLNRAFELFVQGPQAIDRAQGGLGLGLTIVKSLVERHGGSVSASSAGTDRGSEFVVRLPRPDASIAEVATRPRFSSDVRADVPEGRRVLVVDDNEDAAEMLAVALGSRGCNVVIAHSGGEALELAATQEFDTALLDIGLPGMDGYELAQRLRALPLAARTRLVAVTGYGQQRDRQRALDAGFDHHLVKPVDLSQLEALIMKAAPIRAEVQ